MKLIILWSIIEIFNIIEQFSILLWKQKNKFELVYENKCIFKKTNPWIQFPVHQFPLCHSHTWRRKGSILDSISLLWTILPLCLTLFLFQWQMRLLHGILHLSEHTGEKVAAHILLSCKYCLEELFLVHISLTVFVEMMFEIQTEMD